MVIQSSNVAMRAGYQFSRRTLDSLSFTSWGDAVNKADSTAATTPTATDSEQTTGKVTEKEAQSTQENAAENAAKWLGGTQTDVERLFAAREDDDIYSGRTKTEYGGLKNLLMLLSGEKEKTSRKISPQDLFSQMLRQYQERLNRVVFGLGLGDAGVADGLKQLTPTQSFSGNLSVRSFYEERESTSFYSSGTVVTADGRQIEFDIEAEMSRSFAQYTDVQIDFGAAQLMDPLVINMEGGTTEVSDQKFLFDIDCDGELDNISLLAKGCGFLALDRNNDGVINDGSELFGTKSGNGFADLAVFDMDGNGWIDENDEVFNRLRIWTKDDAGNDKLVALGVAGIGAIYLGSASTQFSLNSQLDNSTNAQIRSSGLYLHEDGTAGIIQQVDMAVEKPEARIAV